jgi:hypothetical protein
MKSIKEKAEESSLGYDEVQTPAISRGFVLGANYVLEQVEKLIYSNPTCERAIFELGELVEQLKK